MSGKGSKPRPFSVSNQEYAERWDAIFGRDRQQLKGEEKPQQNQGHSKEASTEAAASHKHPG